MWHIQDEATFTRLSSIISKLILKLQKLSSVQNYHKWAY